MIVSLLAECALFLLTLQLFNGWTAGVVGLEIGSIDPQLLFQAKLIELPLALAMVWLLLRLRRERSVDIGLRLSSQGAGPDLRFGAFMAIPLLVLATAAGLLARLVVNAPEDSVFRVADWSSYGWLLATGWVAGGFLEEIQFRGYLFRRLEQLMERFAPGGRLNRSRALILASAVFGLLHLYQGPVAVVSAMAAAAGLQFVFLKSGRRLLPCMVCHGLFDTVQISLLFATQEAVPV